MNLHVIKLPKNTGTPGLPRNVGIQFARGKYIAFLDSDDLYTKTALEELSTLAEEYKADIVHMNDSFRLFGSQTLPDNAPQMTDFKELTNPANFSLFDWRGGNMPRLKPFDAPTLMPSNFEERLKIWLERKYRWATCTTFCRRDFLITNQILFSNISTSEDVPFCFECMCNAKNCLQVPNIVYIIRSRAGSVSHENLSTDFEKYFRKRVSAFNDVFNEFERIMNKIPFLKKRADYRYAVLDWYTNMRIPFAFQYIYAQVHPVALHTLVEKEFHGDDAAFTAYLFNTVNIQRLQIMQLQHELAKFQKQ